MVEPLLTQTSDVRVGRILVIEDDAAIREALYLILLQEGYAVTQAANGLEGLAVLKKLPHPDLIILDLMMPVMNGWAFIDVVEEDHALRNIPILVITAFCNQTAPIKSRTVLTKPLNVDVLLEFAKRYCCARTLM